MPRPDRPGRGRDPNQNPQSRGVMLSKSLSRLLRHAAQQEGVPISTLGYVRCDHLLAWRGMNKFSPRPAMEEVVKAVRESEKLRFGLRYEPHRKGESRVGSEEDVEEVAGEVANLGLDESEVKNETERALEVFDMGSATDAKHFWIRANQGHSMKDISSEGLLKQITLDGEVPENVVHGTFYAAWESISKEGKVRRMDRNCVHFSTGPALRDVLEDKLGGLGDMMEKAKVKSGMRKDAQVLIYVDVKKGLEHGMKWWVSENGVVLTEGDVESQFWDVVVEVKEGLGVLWREGKEVMELPERFQGRGMPRGKVARGGGRRGRGGGRPKLRVEKDDFDGDGV